MNIYQHSFAENTTGLNFVKDAGFVPVIVSLVIIFVGIILTFIHKARSVIND